MLAGSVFDIVGLARVANAHGFVSALIGGGVLIGFSLACTTAAIATLVAPRGVPETVRSTVMDIRIRRRLARLLHHGLAHRVALGLTGGIIQIASALIRPRRRRGCARRDCFSLPKF